MYDNTIQQALGDISDTYLESAMDVYERKRKARKRWDRVVACAAVLALLLGAMFFWPVEENYVTGPGMITVRAHAVDEDVNETMKSVVLEEGVEFTPNAHYDSALSIVRHFPFTFTVDKSLYPDMAITIEVMTDAGILYTNRKSDDAPQISPDMPAVMQLFLTYSGQHFTTDIDAKVCWEPNGFDYDHMAKEIEKGNFDFSSAYKPLNYEKVPAFIDVIIRADDYIVGYCVIEIREINGDVGYDADEFSFKVLTIVNFPKVDGKHQNVPLNYVQTQIRKIHSEREARL